VIVIIFILFFTVIIEIGAVIYLFRKTDSTLLKFCVVALIALSYVPDPIPYVDEILMHIIVFKNREFAAKLVSTLNVVNLLLSGLIVLP
jgi:hypothetical protein